MFDEPTEAKMPDRDERISMVEDYCKMERALADARETAEDAQRRAEKLQAEMATLRGRLGSLLGIAAAEVPMRAQGDY